MIDPSYLDSILEAADSSPGVAVRTTNPRRLSIELNLRITHHRSSHPLAYKNLSLLASRSPLELYIINKDHESAQAEEPTLTRVPLENPSPDLDDSLNRSP